MKLELLRYGHFTNATAGLLFTDEQFTCYTLEDEFRAKKVMGRTRIPNGQYNIKFREVSSNLTLKYRAKYHWFTYHLELQNVPGFKYVYIHVGNTDEHTDGCILIGEKGYYNGNYTVENSALAYEKFYKKVQRELHSGNDVTINIINL